MAKVKNTPILELPPCSPKFQKSTNSFGVHLLHFPPRHMCLKKNHSSVCVANWEEGSLWISHSVRGQNYTLTKGFLPHLHNAPQTFNPIQDLQYTFSSDDLKNWTLAESERAYECLISIRENSWHRGYCAMFQANIQKKITILTFNFCMHRKAHRKNPPKAPREIYCLKSLNLVICLITRCYFYRIPKYQKPAANFTTVLCNLRSS